MLKSIWWLPIRVGIPLAMLAGGAACWPQRGDLLYLVHYQLYRSAVMEVAGQLNRAAAYLVSALVCLTLLILILRVAFRRAGLKSRWAAALVFVAACAISVHYFHYDRLAWYIAIDATNALVPEAYQFLLLPGIAGVGVLLAVGRHAIARVSRRGWQWVSQPLCCLFTSGARVAGVTGLLLAAGFVGINLAAGLLWLHGVAKSARQPNVILIMVDTLRADHVGCYGYTRNTTPNIDRFAGESTLFSTAIAQAPWTLWSVFSFMTSTYADGVVFDVDTDDSSARSRPPLLAEILRNEGYATHAVLSNPVFEQVPVFRNGFDVFDITPAENFLGITSPAVTEATVRQLHLLSRRRPFFFYTVYFDPHDPYHAHPEYAFSASSSGMRPRKLSRALDVTAPRPAGTRRAEPLGDLYDSEIAFTDAEVGKLLKALKDEGLYDDALIILLSDHGEELREHGSTGHMYTLYDEVLRVPLLIKLPGQRAGRVVEGEFSLIDLLPSILGTIGARTPAPRALGTDAGFAKVQHCTRAPIHSSTVDGVFSARDSQYKFIANALASTEELYDLSRDPWEQRNLAPGHRELAARWHAVLRARAGQAPVVTTHQTNGGLAPNMSQETLDKLRALGYLQ